MFHLLSAKSKELFNSAILMSNAASFKYQTFEEALNATEWLITFMNCSEERIACLRYQEPAMSDLINYLKPFCARFSLFV